MRIRLSSLVVLASLTPAIALAQMPMDGRSHDPAMSAPQSTPGTTGTVNAVDVGKRTINLSHGPISALGWPAMTMDFGTVASIDLSGVKPGDAVAFTVSKASDGVYLIDTLKPAK